MMKLFGIIKGSLIVLLIFSHTSCGISESKYVPYEEVNQPTQGSNSDCAAGEEAFALNLGEMVSRCTACHGVEGQSAHSKMALSDSAAANRKAFINSGKYPDAAKFFSYISTHPGSSAVKTADEESLSLWEAAENTCQ